MHLCIQRGVPSSVECVLLLRCQVPGVRRALKRTHPLTSPLFRTCWAAITTSPSRSVWSTSSASPQKSSWVRSGRAMLHVCLCTFTNFYQVVVCKILCIFRPFLTMVTEVKFGAFGGENDPFVTTNASIHPYFPLLIQSRVYRATVCLFFNIYVYFIFYPQAFQERRWRSTRSRARKQPPSSGFVRSPSPSTRTTCVLVTLWRREAPVSPVRPLTLLLYFSIDFSCNTKVQCNMCSKYCNSFLAMNIKLLVFQVRQYLNWHI